MNILSWKTWKDLGICLFPLERLYQCIKIFIGDSGERIRTKARHSPMVFHSCSYFLVSRVRMPVFEFWAHCSLGNCRHWTFKFIVRWRWCTVFLTVFWWDDARLDSYNAKHIRALSVHSLSKCSLQRKVVGAEKIARRLCNSRLLWCGGVPFIQSLTTSCPES